MTYSPIIVDLDDTFVNTDTLFEQIARLIFGNFSKIPGAVSALFGGKALLKSYCAQTVSLDVSLLNYNAELIEFLHKSKAEGARIILCTATDKRVADAISEYHVGLFDEVIATETGVNLKGPEKARVLKERFPEGFIYAGDSSADLAVWREAKGIILVGASKSTAKKAKALGAPVIAEYIHPATTKRSRFRTWAKALRVQHWTKNILMLVPIILAHLWLDAEIVLRTLIGFLLLLAATSSSYLINDLADLDADRRHPTKHLRPIPCGAISIRYALMVPMLVIPITLAIAYALEPAFSFALMSYLVLTLAYSFGLKRIPLLDTLIIGTLFTSRIIMGGLFLGAAPSIWLLVFSMFFFFSLATAKRQVEVLQIENTESASTNGRGYVADDAPLLLSVGVASSVASLLILVLYLRAEAFDVVGYARPEFLWLTVVVIAIWLGRIWLLTHRKQMFDDPVSFALKDGISVVLGALIVFAFVAAV